MKIEYNERQKKIIKYIRIYGKKSAEEISSRTQIPKTCSNDKESIMRKRRAL